MSIPELCIRRPVMTTLVMAALILFGGFAYRVLPVAELPNVDFPILEVSARLPGANPETMAAAVATPLESAFSRISGLRSMTSYSTLGSTRVTLEFDLDRNINEAALDLQSAISSTQRSLPPDLTEPPSFRKVNPADFPVYYLALSSPSLPVSAINEYAETVLQQQISTINGVAQVQLWGQQKYAVRLQVNPDALVTRQIGFDEIERAVKAGNSNLATGSLNSATRETAIKTTGQLSGANAYNDMIVAWRSGAPVRFKDVGRAIDGVEQDKSSTYFGERAGMMLVVYRQPGSNTVEIVEEIKRVLPQFKLQLPASIDIDVIYDRSITIRDSIHDVEFTLVLAGFLVVLVIFLFLRSLTATLIASIALPISVIGTFSAMHLLGFSLNNLSMMALVLAVGFVVDDAIVVLENIVRHRERGASAMQAAIDGSKEIAFTVVSMTVSLVAVFIPIMFMGGMIGRLLNEFALTITVAILVSGVVSLTLTPMLCSRFLGASVGAGGADHDHDGVVFGAVKAAYGWSLRWCLRNHIVVLLSFVATIWATVVMFQNIQKDFLPEEDTGRLLARTEAGDDASYEAVVAYQREVSRIASADPNIAQVMSRAGGGGPASTNNQGFLLLTLKARADRPEPDVKKIVQDLRRKLNQVPGLRVFVINPPAIRVGGRLSNAAYQYTLQDLDLDTLYRWAERIRLEMRQLPGFQDVSSDLKVAAPTALVKIDRDRAAALGVDAAQIETVLAAAFGSRKISTIYASSNQYAVILEVDPAFQRDAAALSKLYVRSAQGRLVPLDSVTTVSRDVAPLSVSHQGLLPAVTLSFNLAADVSLGTAIEQIRAMERRLQIPATMTTSFAGTAAAFEQSMQGMGLLLLMAILVVYIVLGILYESFVHPLTILSGLPAAGLGALLALTLFGLPLTLYAFVGIMMLVGIVKKNAIMMIDFAVQAERERGVAPADAIYEASLVRFRPIMMTTFAALMGALPIAIGHGAGAEARAPLGITVVGGLAVSQVITLYLTPVIYLYFHRLGRIGRSARAPGAVREETAAKPQPAE